MHGWLVGIHLIGIIMWMGGLFGLTRHVGMHADLDDAPRPALNLYESKSYFMGTLPGMILTLGAGLWMLFSAPGPAAYLKVDQGYGTTFHVKLLLVVILIVIDQIFLFRMRKLHADGVGSRGQFMALHGVIGLCFIIIVLLMESRILA